VHRLSDLDAVGSSGTGSIRVRLTSMFHLRARRDRREGLDTVGVGIPAGVPVPVNAAGGVYGDKPARGSTRRPRAPGTNRAEFSPTRQTTEPRPSRPSPLEGFSVRLWRPTGPASRQHGS